jgi:hypothetical protein
VEASALASATPSMSERSTAPPCARPDLEWRTAVHPRGIGQREQQEVARVLAQITKEAVAGAARDPAGLGQVHRPQVLGDQPAEHAGGPAR